MPPSSELDQRLAQVAALADPDRVQILWIVITEPMGLVSDSVLGGGDADVARTREHLQVLHRAGLLERKSFPGGEDLYGPTRDALGRFSLLLTGLPPRESDLVDFHARQLTRLGSELAQRFVGVFAAETVTAFVQDSYERLRAISNTPRHLPLMTLRYASERLHALARAEELAEEHRGAGSDRGTPPHDEPVGAEVLFVCVANSGRSQIAAALLRARAGGRVVVRTAGTAPASTIDPVVRTVLQSMGVEVVTEFPKPLTTELVRASDWVITMGCGDACPLLPGRRYLDWPVPDVAGMGEEQVRQVVAQIDAEVMTLLTRVAI